MFYSDVFNSWKVVVIGIVCEELIIVNILNVMIWVFV